MHTKDWWILLGFIIISQAAGLIGSVFTASAIPEWYATLTLPAFAPPNWIFGPVWTTLYVFMGIAAFIVWRNRHAFPGKRAALTVFFIQLALNAVWSIIFFGLQNPGAAFLEIIALWIAVATTLIMFARFSRTAAVLLVPYLLWVTFAGYLNYSIWILNA
ncbi:MAG: TspO/MBR family protein [Candidatus Paceibacterota bacterium]